jgi:hypothetical protein
VHAEEQHVSLSEKIIEVLRSRDDGNRILIEAIRDGYWNTTFFEMVASQLRELQEGRRAPLSESAYKQALMILAGSFAAKDRWPYDASSSEYKALSVLVSEVLNTMTI